MTPSSQPIPPSPTCAPASRKTTRLVPRGLLLAALCLAQTTTAPQLNAASDGPDRIPIVVELFTSEGCSSCPPADQLLDSMQERGVSVLRTRRLPDPRVSPAQDPAQFQRARRPRPMPEGVELILLSEHVDYWDSLGWKDTYSSPLFSARQQAYGRVFNTGSVYTPQAVVNGRLDVIGSDARALRDAIADAAQDPLPVDVELTRGLGDTFVFRAGSLPKGSHHSDLLLAVSESGLGNQITAGENGGRYLKHTAVVRSLTKLAELDPDQAVSYVAEARLNLRPEWKRRNLKLVLLVQDQETRHILGAASLQVDP